MKYGNYYLISFFIIGIFTACSKNSNPNLIEIPLTTMEGYGPFYSAMGGLGYDNTDESNPWRNTYGNITGIPENWTDVKKGRINIDIYQMVYQEYHRGNISPEFYQQLQESWKWEPDSTELSKKPIKCTVGYITGVAPDGVMKIIVDKNNNDDLSDDEAFVVPKREMKNEDNQSIMDSVFYVSYERLLNDKVVTEKIPMAIYDLNYRSILFNTIPQYKKGSFEGHELAVHSGFSSLVYNKTVLGVLDGEDTGKIPHEKTIGNGEYLEIGDNLYKYKGVSKNREVLLLEKVNQPASELSSTQLGFRAPDFQGENFITKEVISLEGLKGKYIYLDFWAVWCGPCVTELPDLKAIYEKVNTDKIEIISVVGDSPGHALEEMIEKHGITWPQILSDGNNEITGIYGIGGYPTTFLIDPNGVIIARDIRSKELEDKIRELNL